MSGDVDTLRQMVIPIRVQSFQLKTDIFSEMEVFMRVTLFVLDVNCGDPRILGTRLKSAPGISSILPLATAHKRT